MAATDPGAPALSVVRSPLLVITGAEVMTGLRSALAWLQANQEQANDLNVFPVPDGDTGSNMYLTLRSAVEEAQRAPDQDSAASVMAAAAHGSLMGARGNSGVILSQVFRGFAQGLERGARTDAITVARALTEASAVADKAVMKPTEGTILTVVREAARAALAAATESTDLRTVLELSVREAHAAVERTTDQLDVLRDAGVVDAGGFGFAVILEGFARAISDVDLDTPLSERPRRRSGEPRVRVPGDDAPLEEAPVPPKALATAPRRGAARVAEREEGWGYCTEFLISGPGLDVDSLRIELAAHGESALIVGDPDLVRVHIHTSEPAPLITLASQRGTLSKLKVEDMSAQHHEILERADAEEEHGGAGVVVAERARISVVPVALGDGFREIMQSLGAARVVEGGQTMNPSTEDLLTAVREANADAVILLPNNGNVILTAQQVDSLAEGVDVRVVPTRNLPQGISALLTFDPTVGLEDNCVRMQAAAERVRSVEITRAVRDSSANGHDIRAGDVLALVDDDITHVGSDDAEVVEAVLRSLDEPPELVTVFHGTEATAEQARQLVDGLGVSLPNIEFELQAGGQDHYPYVLSLE